MISLWKTNNCISALRAAVQYSFKWASMEFCITPRSRVRKLVGGCQSYLPLHPGCYWDLSLLNIILGITTDIVACNVDIPLVSNVIPGIDIIHFRSLSFSSSVYSSGTPHVGWRSLHFCMRIVTIGSKSGNMRATFIKCDQLQTCKFKSLPLTFFHFNS